MRSFSDPNRNYLQHIGRTQALHTLQGNLYSLLGGVQNGTSTVLDDP